MGQHHRPPIVHIDHAACTVGGNDDEPIMLVKFDAELSGRCAELANTGSQRRVTILASDQVRLFFRSALINPFEPVGHGCDCPMWPDRPEEWAAGHFLDSSVYRRSTVLGPVRPPTPTHQVCVQGFILLVIDCNSFYASCERGDEAFADLTVIDGLDALGRKIRAQVLRGTGIAVGVGIATTKTLAKLANHTAKRLQARTGGVVSITDPAKRDWVLRKKFSIVIEKTARELAGTSCLELNEPDPPKPEICCSRMFVKRLTELPPIKEALATKMSRK